MPYKLKAVPEATVEMEPGLELAELQATADTGVELLCFK
jgi:hypothetical protein